MTPITEIIFSGFVSKVVNDIVDVSKDKIKKAVKSKNTKYQSVESQIYNVIVDVLNKITGNRYKNEQDNIYDVAEALFKSLKENSRDELGYIKSCLQVLGLNSDQDGCLRFKVSLYEELGKNEYGELFRAILMLQLEHKNQYDHVVYEQLNQKLDEVIIILNRKDGGDERDNERQKVKSRTQEYADKWNENMFLNDFSEWDEKAGTNVKLKDVYIETHLPHFIWGNNKRISSELKVLLSKYIDNKNKNQMLLILGQPGIGKSTLITWITKNLTHNIDRILVYKFVDDLNTIEWKNKNLSFDIVDKILRTLNLTYDTLYGKVMILDGFDEVSMGEFGFSILNQLYRKLIKNTSWYKVSIIVTCRENYIKELHKVECDYITLQPWNEIQIKSFCGIFQSRTNINISEYTIKNVIDNKDILGIPLILYMVLALNIVIEKKSSLVDVYDKIFSLEGGIYDRCIDNKNFEYFHRISEIKKQIHQISREIALWMFENNPAKANIPREVYENTCNDVIQVQSDDGIKQDFLIGNFFKLVRHCEGIGTEKLYFVHRSIFQYFVVENFFCAIKKDLFTFSGKNQENIMNNIANYMKTGQLDNTMGEFLKYKIFKEYDNMNIDKKGEFWRLWDALAEKMMKHGMLNTIKGNMQRFDYIAKHEAICFRNTMYLLSLISEIYPQNKYILSDIEEGLLLMYVRLYSAVSLFSVSYGVDGKRLHPLYIQKAVFTGRNYSDLYLAGANFYGSNFTNQDLKKSILSNADLTNVVMVNTNLVQAKLEHANMKKANLSRADLTGADLEGANLTGANLEASIWHESDIQKIIPQLKTANFTYLIAIEDDDVKKIQRSELFPNEENIQTNNH